MEAETIDLTDPLEQLLGQTGWTPEYLQERLQKLSDENAKEASTNKTDFRDVTLNDLLRDCKSSNINKNVECIETIELSDDDVSEGTDNVTDNRRSEIQDVSEVGVIEIRDDYEDCNGEYNEDDDDDFFEETTIDELHSSNENFDEEFEEPTDKSSESREYNECIKNEISDKIDGSTKKSVKSSSEKNIEETNIGSHVYTDKSSITNNPSGKTLLTNSNVLNEHQFFNDEEIQGSNNDYTNLTDKKRQCPYNSQKNCENSSNLKFLNESSKFLSWDNKSLSSGSCKSAFSELDGSIKCKTSENNAKNNSDLEFTVCEHQGGLNLINTFMKNTHVTLEQTDTNNESKVICTTEGFDNLPLLNKDMTSDKLLASNSEKENTEDDLKDNLCQDSNVAPCNASEKLVAQTVLTPNIETENCNKSSCLIKCDERTKFDDLKNGECISSMKYIRKSIDEIIEQLDKACEEDSTSKEMELNNKMNTNESTQISYQPVKINSPTHLLLKSLDEAIETCSLNNLSSSTSHSLSSVEDQIELDKSKEEPFLTKVVAKPPHGDQKLTTNSDLVINQDSSVVNAISRNSITVSVLCEYSTDVDKIAEDKLDRKEITTLINREQSELSTETDNDNKNDCTKSYLEKSIYGNAEIDETPTINEVVESKVDKSENLADTLCLLVTDSSTQSSKHSLHASSFESTIKTNSAANNIEVNRTTNNLEDDSNNYNLNKKSDNIADCKIQNNVTEANIGSLIMNTTRNEVFHNEPFKNTTNDCESLEAVNKKTKIMKDNIELRLQGMGEGSNKKASEIDDKFVLNIKKKIVTNLQPNLDDNCSFVEEFPTEEKLLNSNIQTNSSKTRENCLSKSKKGIQSSSENVHNANESYVQKDIFVTSGKLTEIREPDEKSKFSTKDDMKDNNTEEESSQENLEEIRKNLKLQLTSLRNRKKMNILQDVKTKFNNIEFSKNSLFSGGVSQETIALKPFEDLKESSSNVFNKKLNENLQPKNLDSVSLVSHSVEPSDLELVTESPEDEDVPNVLNEIRKIIRKQKSASKFSVLNSNHNSEGADIRSSGNESPKNDKTDDQKGEDKGTGALSTTVQSTDPEVLTTNNLEDEKILSDNVVNSPFISNTLDEFLTDAKLNVSYTIPKCGAEEGLRQNYFDEPIMPPVIADVKEEDSAKPTQEVKYKPKTLAEKRRLLEKNKLKEKKRLAKIKKLEETQKRSYVLYKDRKIFLETKSMGKCIASIESFKPLTVDRIHQHATTKKPSLLTELYKKATSPVKYRPGPLCKKHLLQTDHSNWTTKLQTLPKVMLNVMPHVGKPIHPNLLHVLPQWDGEVTDDQIEFALSALVTKEESKQDKIFEFDIHYQNHQTHILTRKRILNNSTSKLDVLATTKECSSTSEEDVAQVMEKLLQYVEIKELAPTIIKYDEDSTVTDESPLKMELPSLDNHVLVKRKSRFTKTDRELLRLNCKVVSVEVEENEPERQCFKPYCRLGCICKSLQCEKIIGLHCQKVKCIFGCTCPKEKDKIISIAEPTIKLPAGTDLLSTDTVTRIEGEAKRNLAKVEKEFTQTVILTNNKTIVVGFGKKPRRATKTPKKYTDFFDDEIQKDEHREIEKEKTIQIQQCFVDMEHWDFSEILPYCLVHRLYQCHCRGYSMFLNNIHSEDYKKDKSALVKVLKEETSISRENDTNILLSRNDTKKQNPKRTVEESFKDIIRKSVASEKNPNYEEGFEETLYSVTGRPLRKRKKIYEADFVFDADNPTCSQKSSAIESDPPHRSETFLACEPDDCSRTRKISHKYYRKTRPFTKAALYCDFANNLTQADLLKAHGLNDGNNLSESDILKRTVVEERENLLKETETEIHKKKRKQKLQVRKDDDITVKTQEKVVSILKPVRKGKVKSVFKGEIIIDDSEWLKKLGQNAKQPLGGYARILPWTALLHGFVSKSINVYCISDMPLRLLLNVGTKLTGTKILDVETFGHDILAAPLKAKTSWLRSQSENVREIIKWLLSGTLPSRYKTSCLSFLLVETSSDQFEVRGLCTQGENKQDVKKNPTDLPQEGERSDQITEVKHKNMNNEVVSLFVTKGKFRLRELVEDGCDDDLTDNLYMWVGLPEVYKVAKWRVVFLNNDFAYLYFKNIDYSIKYTDLVKLAEMAKEEMLTLILRNVQIRRSYDHASFGIFISHSYLDRLFIGPYFINYDEDEVETLRYINQQLVSSESFNKMTGNPNYRCGHWMYERIYYHTPTVYMKDTIDLTNDDTSSKSTKPISKRSSRVSSSKISVPSTTTPTPSVRTPQLLENLAKAEHIIYHNGMSVHIKNSKPRSPSEFNRFIITNIPHFGYLGAYQPDNSSALEVSWPFEKKVLQFENADNARDFLQERFNQLLQPVPETFKIQVIVLIHLDLGEHQPINADFLSGHCICGYFGTYNFRELNDEFCKEKLNISKEEIVKLFAKRAQGYIKKKIEELAETVGINRTDPTKFNVLSILDRAKEEIKSQENIRKKQISDIQAHELKVVAKMKKLYAIVNLLPIKERNIESKLIHEILQIRPKRLAANEIIEIMDDDDERRLTQSDLVIYNVESDDTNPEQPTGKLLKRKKRSEKKSRKPKVAKVSTFSSDTYMEPSTLASPTLRQPDTTLKVTTIKNVYKGKRSVLMARPHQSDIQSPLEIEDKETVIINEETDPLAFPETETLTINEDTEMIIINEDIELGTINEVTEDVEINKDIETITISGNPEPAFSEEIEILKNNKNIETVVINEDMGTETEQQANQSEENENPLSVENVDDYIIEYDESDPNITEIIVSQPDTIEHIDLSKATVIASVPPTTSDLSNKNPVTVSVDSPKMQLSNTISLKTHSNNDSFNKFSIASYDKADLDIIKQKSATVTTSKELTSKIQLGLQRIIKKSQGNLLRLNQKENPKS